MSPLSLILPLWTLAAGLVGATSFLDAGAALGEAAFKKYAMMKIFEDCYGKETVRDMYREVSEACQRCHHREASPMAVPQDVMAMFQEKPKKPKLPTVPVGPMNVPWYHQTLVPHKNFYYYPMHPPTYFQYGPMAPMAPASTTMVKRDAMPAPSSGGATNDKMMELVAQLNSKIGNVTCVMRELGFLGEDQQPDYESIRNRLEDLPVSDELKADLVDGMETCREFSMCLPTKGLDKMPVFQELAKPLVFFNCFKGKKLAACIKQDLRFTVGNDVDDSLAMGRHLALNVQASGQSDPSSMFNMIYGFDMDNMAAVNPF